MEDQKPELSIDWRSRTGDFRSANLQVSIPPAFQRLIETASSPIAADALRRQVEPSEAENRVLPEESADPLGEARYCITPRLVHQYRNRVLLLSTGQCIGHCRYCFRRNYTALNEGVIASAELDTVCEYLAFNQEIREILVSGGDPMSISPEELQNLLHRIRTSRPDILIRLCTRAPVFAPQLFTSEFLLFLRRMKPLWLIPHINHSAELGPDQVACLSACIDAGIPVQSQTVLLKDINDSPQILEELFNHLVCIGVKPGYLFQCDLAPGTSHFRVPLAQGFAIWRNLRTLLSGLSLPVYAVDLPGGGGKFPLVVPALAPLLCSKQDGASFAVQGLDGKVYIYPF